MGPAGPTGSEDALMPVYMIKDVWRCGVKRWLVIQDYNPIEVARFELRREAVAWILKQEQREKQEAK